jgi:flagellar hook-associated protein 2
VLSQSVTGGAGALTRLSEIGVTVQKDGSLGVNATKLNNAITSNFDDFAGLFASAGKSSDSLVNYTGFSPATKPGAYDVNVTQLATKGRTVGTGAAGLTVGVGSDTLDVVVNGLTATITLQQKTYANAAELAAEIQSKINGAPAFVSAGANVAVTESSGTLTITSAKYGSASKASITGGNGQLNLKFATDGSMDVTGLDVTGTINGLGASGNGQVLTSSTGDSAGLALTVAAGVLGARGTVNYSQGYAFQFDKMATALLGTGGPLTARTDGIAASIKALDKSQADLTARLAVTEKRYRAQFTALDLTISKMNTTSTFLTQQLAQISGLSSQ